jgi:prepilin-type N-terminal cleavage/methylation domain-containing protein
MIKITENNGFTLYELLIAITILGIIMGSLYQVMGSALSAYEYSQSKQALVIQARNAMERMVRFVQETDKIHAAVDKELKVNERLLDTYDNHSHAYLIAGDNLPDADYDGDGLINEGDGDDEETVRFKYDSGTHLLMERLPDYGTAIDDDYRAETEICSHVTRFKCGKLNSNVVEIELTLNDGPNEVNLKTRVGARFVQ